MIRRFSSGMLTIATGLILFAAFSLGSGVIPSQPPSPTPNKPGQNQKGHTQEADKQTTANPQGTEKNPIVIKSLEAEKTPEREKQDRTERDEKAANERSMVTWTIVLAITTIVLAGIAGGQFGMFWKQLGLIERSLKATEDATTAAQVQASAAEQQVMLATSPRLYIDGIRVEDFVIGMCPVFFVRIANAGHAIAANVSINIRVQFKTGGAKYRKNEHTIMVPANGYREYFIAMPQAITNAMTDDLCVSRYFVYNNERTDYCYKYNSSHRAMPQFIPCDFDMRQVILVTTRDQI